MIRMKADEGRRLLWCSFLSKLCLPTLYDYHDEAGSFLALCLLNEAAAELTLSEDGSDHMVWMKVCQRCFPITVFLAASFHSRAMKALALYSCFLSCWSDSSPYAIDDGITPWSLRPFPINTSSTSSFPSISWPQLKSNRYPSYYRRVLSKGYIIIRWASTRRRGLLNRVCLSWEDQTNIGAKATKEDVVPC